jgi:hypothetical protein
LNACGPALGARIVEHLFDSAQLVVDRLLLARPQNRTAFNASQLLMAAETMTERDLDELLAAESEDLGGSDASHISRTVVDGVTISVDYLAHGGVGILTLPSMPLYAALALYAMGPDDPDNTLYVVTCYLDPDTGEWVAPWYPQGDEGSILALREPALGEDVQVYVNRIQAAAAGTVEVCDPS